MSRNYKFHNKAGLYFVSFATINWIDVFTRQMYFDVLADCVSYCRKDLRLRKESIALIRKKSLYCYCFMSSHVHFIFRSTNEQPSELLRDFKRHTSKKILEAIENNPQECRKEWLLWMFEKAGKKQGNISKYQFWKHHNKPIELWSEKVIKQKTDYIHNNPIASGFVTNAVDWKYSSVRNFQDDATILEIDASGFIQ